MKWSPSSNTIVCTGRLPAEHFCKICLSFQLSPAAHGPTYPAAQPHSPEAGGETETSSRHGTVPELWLPDVQLHRAVTSRWNYGIYRGPDAKSRVGLSSASGLLCCSNTVLFRVEGELWEAVCWLSRALLCLLFLCDIVFLCHGWWAYDHSKTRLCWKYLTQLFLKLPHLYLSGPWFVIFLWICSPL